MDWPLPHIFSEDNPGLSSELVVEVVACLWAAAERYQTQGDSANAILVLSKLICSRFGCSSLEVELGTRLRLAELCSTQIEYCEIALEQLNRAWAIASHGKKIEDVLIELLILKLKDMVHWTRFQVYKSKNEAVQCLKFVNQGFQLCTVPSHSVLVFKTYFQLRKSEILRLNGDLGDHEAAIAKTNYSLPPSRVVARWAPKDRKKYENCHVFCVLVVSLQKTIHMIEKFENTQASHEISIIRTQMTQNGISSDLIDSMIKCAEFCILFNEAKFVLALKKLEQIEFEDFKRTMELECLRYIGSAKSLKMAEEDENYHFYEDIVYQIRHLKRLEAKFSISIQFGKIAQALRWLSKWYSQCIEYWPQKASSSLEATYWVMNGTLGASCGKFEFAHSCFSLALSVPLLPCHRTTILCHTGLVDIQRNLEVPVREIKLFHEMVPCECWYHVKAAILRSNHNVSNLLGELKAFNQFGGSLPLEIWIGIQTQEVPTHSVKLAKNASYIEGEYYSSKKILLNAGEGKMTLSRLQSILEVYLARVALLKY